jgi:hypothetical protein
VYEFIFQSKMLTAASGGLLLVLACAVTARVGFWWRVLALNFGPVFAAGFMVAILLSDQRFSTIDVIAALVFEFVVLCILCRFTYCAYHLLHSVGRLAARRILVAAALLYIGSVTPSALGGGFGIFSSGTRIDYLYESSLAKYFTYAGLMISVVLGGVLARRITLNRRPQVLDYVVILLVSTASILAGSKGGFFLWLGSVVAFVDYGAARIRPRTIVFALAGTGGLIAVLAIVVSEFLRISVPDFFELAFARFFVNNDARALAFDLRTLEVNPIISLVSELFRSASTVFGYAPHNSPLGVELYDRYFGPSGGAGANASLVAMMIFYTNPGSALLPLLLSAVAAALLFLLGEFTSTRMPSAFSRYALNIIATLNIAQLSQDVLAFQVVLPMTVIMATLFYIFGNIHVFVDQQPRSAAR